MRKILGAAAVAAAIVFGARAEEPAATPPPTTTPADTALIQRLTGADMLAILKEVGFTGELKVNGDGNPQIVGGYVDPETKKSYAFLATLYRCEEGAGCYDIVFTRSYEASMPVTLQMVNKYNQTRIFGVAYLDSGGQVGQSLSHTIQGGVTRQTVKEIIDWWREVMVSFDSQLNAK